MPSAWRQSLCLTLLLAGLWGVGLAVPTLLRGELLGHGWTDLYPSVWGMWGFANAQPALPTATPLLGFPEGLGFYYASPLKGWLAWPLLSTLSLTATWNLLTVLARVGTVLAAWWAARGVGLGPRGSSVAAAAYGCAPFFHGYAVEGIAEGTDGWTLALLLGALGRGWWARSALLLALTVASSWYLGAAGCLLVALVAVGRREPRAVAVLLLGLAAASPLILGFLEAFPAGEPLPATIRRAMGAPLRIPVPGLQAGVQPFALTAYVGWLLGGAALLAAREHRWVAGAVLVPAILSLGAGPWYELPVFEALRFPYRWHAATLALLALLAGRTAERWRWGWLLGPAIAVEGVLLSPVEPVIPGASPDVPSLYEHVTGPVLEVPGPVSLPPGEVNPSRLRSRALLYFQTGHGQPSPWVPDFNAVGVLGDTTLTEPFRDWDRLETRHNGRALPTRLAPGTVGDLRAAGVRHVVLDRSELGAPSARRLQQSLEAQGAVAIETDEQRTLLTLPPAAEGDTAAP